MIDESLIWIALVAFVALGIFGSFMWSLGYDKGEEVARVRQLEEELKHWRRAAQKPPCID